MNLFPGIALTKTERTVMDLFVTRLGELVTRDTLLTEAWGYAPGTKTRTVTSTIERIRRKLEGTGLEIKTVWGEGFIFEVDACTHEHLVAILRGVSAEDPKLWAGRYLSGTIDETFMTIFEERALAQAWEEALGEEHLASAASTLLQRLRPLELLEVHEIAQLLRLAPHMVFDLDALDAIRLWMGSCLSVEDARDLLGLVQTETPSTQAKQLSLLGWAEALAKRNDSAQRWFGRARALFPQVDPALVPELIRREAWLPQSTGEHARAIALVEEALSVAQDRHAQVLCQYHLAKLRLETHAYGAVEDMRDATVALRTIEAHEVAIFGQLLLALHLVRVGAHDEARAELREIDYEDLRPTSQFHYLLTQSMLALRTSTQRASRWLSREPDGAAAHATTMRRFLRALYTAQTRGPNTTDFEEFLTPPVGPWSHIRALVACLVLETEPTWELTADVREAHDRCLEGWRGGSFTLIDCFFELARHPLPLFATQHA